MSRKTKSDKPKKKTKLTPKTKGKSKNGDEQTSDAEPSGLESDGNNATKKDHPPKFKFKCQMCGICCETETVYITISDLDRWIKDSTIYRVMHLLDLEESENRIRIFLKKDDDGYCNLYHRDNKQCTLYDSRPIACRSYPLGYNGDNYYLKSKKCKGLNKGQITKEELGQIRDDAFEEYIASRLSDRVIPMLRGIFINKLLEQSQEFIEKVSEKKSDTEPDAKH